MAGLRRYRHIGRVYDLISFERLLYAAPRRRLMSLIGPVPGATVIDVGCGTGLNLAGLYDLVGPSGRIVGVDASESMLGEARGRSRRAGWANVTLVDGDVGDLSAAVRSVGLRCDDVDVVVATFVVSTIDDDAPFWRAVDDLCTRRPRLVALADLGAATSTGRLRRVGLAAFAALGGSRLTRRPWSDLAARSNNAKLEHLLGGHVRLAVGHCSITAPRRPAGEPAGSPSEQTGPRDGCRADDP